MKKLTIIVMCFLCILSACKKEQNEIKDPIIEDAILETPDIPPLPEIPANSLKNPLTGLYIDEEVAQKRPIAVTINNLHKALPQSGISQADIIYEVLAEGEITRFVAIFQDMTFENIGPVRSAREYLNLFAIDNDAIYIHHGGSPTGYKTLDTRNVDHIDGMNDTTAFFRDKERMGKKGMYEHSSYIKASGVDKSIKNYGFEQISEDEPMFKFAKPEERITTITEIIVPYSSYQVSSFEYEDGIYSRFQSGEPQIDIENNEQLKFSNVIIQYADTKVVDSQGRRDIDLIGEGTAKLFTNGQEYDATWEKESAGHTTNWFVNGSEMILSEGKTFICIVPSQMQIETK